MTDVTSAANKLQSQEVDFNSPVSESLATRLGGSINYALDRNARWLILDGMGWHRETQLNDLTSYHYITRNCNINEYILTNNTNGSAGAISVNAAVYDDTGVFLNNLFSTAPSINSAISTAGNTTPRAIGRKVEEGVDIEAGTNKVVGTLNFTQLLDGYKLRFFTEGVMTNGAGYLFALRLREID